MPEVILSDADLRFERVLRDAFGGLDVAVGGAKLDALTREVLRQHIDKFAPGDLIRADAFNRLRIELLELRARIEKLAAEQEPGLPEIDRLSKTLIAMGEELQVHGRNLEVGSLVSVQLAKTDVKSFKSGSGSLLVFDVPQIAGIAEPGVAVTLEVTNTRGGPATASLVVKPASVQPEPFKLENILVDVKTQPPGRFVPPTIFCAIRETVRVLLKLKLPKKGRYRITAKVKSNSTWNLNGPQPSDLLTDADDKVVQTMLEIKPKFLSNPFVLPKKEPLQIGLFRVDPNPASTLGEFEIHPIP